MEHARVHIIVSGRVQGVFFRAGAQERARELGLVGWAHNLADGRVELVAEGKKGTLEQFIEWCRKGPPLAKVEHIDVQWEDPESVFDDFSIREFGF